jgi:hypothetical protein
MTLVEPLGKSAFEFFEKDRDVIHASAKAIKQELDPGIPIRLLTITSDSFLESLTAPLAKAGFDPLENLLVRKGLGRRDFA